VIVVVRMAVILMVVVVFHREGKFVGQSTSRVGHNGQNTTEDTANKGMIGAYRGHGYGDGHASQQH